MFNQRLFMSKKDYWNLHKMDSNGNKVQTLRQQFEGLKHNEAPGLSQNHKKLPSNQLTKSNRTDRLVGEALYNNHKTVNGSNRREEMSSNSLLKNGNRCGFIASNKSDFSQLVATSLPSSPEENNNNVGEASSVNNGKIDSLSPSLRSSRRNGIYVSDPIVLHSGESILGSCVGSEDLENNNNSITSNSIIDLDTDDSSGNSQNSKYQHIAVNVKRSNAFRQRDIVDFPEPRSVRNSKLVLDRVKSLELPVPSSNSKNLISANGNRNHEAANSENGESSTTQRASSLCLHQRPKSISTSMTKAVNVVTPYQVSDIYAPQQSSPLHLQKRRSSEKEMTGKETPEYAVPLPVIKRSTPVGGSNKLPEPPKYPPPPPVYKSPSHLAMTTRPYTSYHHHALTKTENHLEGSAPDKRAASICVSNPSSARGPPPEKPPRTFLYDILTDHHGKGSLSLAGSKKLLLSQPTASPQSNKASAAAANANAGNNTFYRKSPTEITDKNKPKVSISTATIRQTTPNSASRVVVEGKRAMPTSSNPHQMLVRSKTESQIILKNSKLRGSAGRLTSTGGVAPLSTSAGARNTLGNHQSQLYLNQPQNNNSLSQFNYEDQQQQLYNIMSNTNLLQRLHHVSNGQNTTIHPLRSESNLVLSVKEEARFGLPPSPHHSSGKEFRISRLHSNSLLFMNNLISLSSSSYGAQGGSLYSSNHGRRNLDSRSDDRVIEKSKSEWALNHIGGYSLHTSSGNSENINSASRSNVESRMGTRRNTVATPNLLTSSSSPIGGSSTPTTGHPSLESNTSTHSSGKVLRTGIQQSIQNLVNQLFSSSSSVIGNNTTKEATSSTDSGIQLGSESLSSCDTPVGDSTTDTGDSDCENDVETSNNARQVVEARKGYIRRVSSIRVQELPSIHRLLQTSRKPASGENLFECLLIVGLNRDPYTGIYHPYIRDKFPPNVKLASGVEQFCFPDSLEWPCHEGPTAQFYTLAITDHRGARKYGCCFRILPEGANICIPIAYVLISANRAIGFYREVLKEITQRHGYTEYEKRYLMEDLYKKSFPAPTEDITVTDPIQDDMYLPYSQQNRNYVEDGLTQCYNNFLVSSPKTIVLRRKADQRLEEGDLVTLLTSLDLTTLLKLFGSLLLERKVVLISRALNTLSLCVEALESMLYPFTWQHTFVPILPLTMTDVLDAPAPFLIGCLRSLQTDWDKTLDEGIVIDLDQSKVLSSVGDENNILPKRIHRKLKNALQFVLNMPDQKEHTKNVLTSECFIRMFVETLGHYSNHIVVQQDGIKIFERESFIKSSDTKATQNFLEWFSETSMFHEFIELRLKGNPPPGLFDQRILEQSELCTPNGQHQHNVGTPLTFKNAKFFMKGTRPFGNWLKEAFVK